MNLMAMCPPMLQTGETQHIEDWELLLVVHVGAGPRHLHTRLAVVRLRLETPRLPVGTHLVDAMQSLQHIALSKAQAGGCISEAGMTMVPVVEASMAALSFASNTGTRLARSLFRKRKRHTRNILHEFCNKRHSR